MTQRRIRMGYGFMQRKFMLGSKDLLGKQHADAAWDRLQNQESVGKILDVARGLCPASNGKPQAQNRDEFDRTLPGA